MVTLIWEGYFENILPILKSAPGEFSEAHSLFRLSAINNGSMPVLRYFEADIQLLSFEVLCIGFLVVEDPNTTQLPGVIGCNLVCLGCEEFGKQCGFNWFENFNCPASVHPVVFSQCRTFYHQEKLKAQAKASSSSQTNVSSSGISSKAKENDPSLESDTTLGQVWVSDPHQPTRTPTNSAKVVTSKLIKSRSILHAWWNHAKAIIYLWA